MTKEKRGLVLVVLGLFMFFAISFSGTAVSGCYLYPQAGDDLYCVSGILDSQAKADCDEHSGCSMDQYFIPGSDCNGFAECKQVTCTVDCRVQALGKCQQKGGQEVTEDQYNYQCSPGCCKISNTFCSFGLNRYECSLKARQLGEADSSSILFQNPIGMSLGQCNQLYCKVQVSPAQLSGTVKDQQGRPVSGATITLDGTNQGLASATDGTYQFPSLSPSTYLVRVSAVGYQTTTATISLLPKATVTKDFTLIPAVGVAEVTGTVTSEGTALPGVTIFWNGPHSGQTVTDNFGKYGISDLTPGQYTFIISKTSYTREERTLTVQEGSQVHDFTLAKTIFQGIQGITSVDFQNDGIGQPEYGVRIYVDGAFRGFSQYYQGIFSIEAAAGEHEITATYQDYVFGPQKIMVASGTTTLNLILTHYIGECTLPNPPKNVAEFTVTPVLGKKQATLQWKKPCLEVVGYVMAKNGNPFRSFSPIQNSFVDDEVEWGQTYKYDLTAVYAESFSPKPITASVTLGGEACEGRYRENTGWETFCLPGDVQARKTVFSCDNQNQIITSLSCAERDGDGSDFYCARINFQDAECKDAGACAREGNPFGLYYSKDSCYGSTNPAAETENYCYYDFTDSVIDQCQSCLQVQNCFDYQSQDACQINNCLGTSCSWIDAAANSEPIIDYGLINLPLSVTPETGHGYCVPEKYAKDDQCALCGPSATLFENNYCTSEVCSSLGRCFSNPQLTSCISCGASPSKQANCYTYNSEVECTEGKGIQKSPFGEFTLSADQCTFGRCLWLANPNSFTAGACVKDGDGDNQDDCAAFSNNGERFSCTLDISPPRTSIIPGGVPIISLARPSLTFRGDDNFHSVSSQRNKMGMLGFCLASTDLRAQSVCGKFKEVPYPGKLPDELVSVNILDSSEIQKEINGETYALKFYSQDKYRNQEDIQQAFVFIDNVPPQFEINEKTTTLGDQTSLVIFLNGINEIMNCAFQLKQTLPAGEAQIQVSGREKQNKEATFDGLNGVIYNLTVSCKDDQGNENLQQKNYVFDLEDRINFIYPAPQAAVANDTLSFKISTVAGAQCALYKTATNEKIADFITDEKGKVHQTEPVSGFTEREYPGEYKAVCHELFSDQVYEDYFHFTVDFTPPSTQIILREKARTTRPTALGWEEFFVEKAAIDFECKGEGFACDKSFYCLGDNCDTITKSHYQEYKSTVESSASTKICYYSTDIAKNSVFAPQCGTIIIDGYGITLEKPELYYYHDEQWGVSNTPFFNWQFFTKVPTTECKFDFVSQFNYASSPGFKTQLPDGSGRYLFSHFPEKAGTSPYSDKGGVKAVYVQCLNGVGEISPEQKINLEYDPIVPHITDAHAEPNPLLEGNKVDLLVATDDKTVCKYSDTGQTDYGLMNYAFPGAEVDAAGVITNLPKTLQERHQAEFSVDTFTGLVKEFSLNTICKNGAGDLSELRTIPFIVDYTQLGGIIALWPDGDYLPLTNITMTLETSKNALCQYQMNGTYNTMAGAGGRFHSQQLSGLQEKYYQIPVKCTMGDHYVEHEVTFTIDLTSPIISEVEDGNYTCGAPIIITVYTNEVNISNYYYELYSINSKQSPAFSGITPAFSSPILSNLILNGSTTGVLPIKIPVAELIENNKYIVRARAQDAAGHRSQFKESDGITITSENFSVCAQDNQAPGISIVSNDSCTSTLIELHCTDVLGCGRFKFGKSSSSSVCSSDQEYLGQQISFKQSQWLCYYAEDAAGNNYTGKRMVSFADEDGDSVADSCDQCPETKAGKTADEDGCGEGQIKDEDKKKDTDKDDLPDAWEKWYDAENCALSFSSKDSDNNAVSDGDEDYDQDGSNNLEEYHANYNPCLADAPPPKNNNPDGGDGGSKTTNILPWVLLIIGLALVLGGSSYLIYYYQFSPKAKAKPKAAPIISGTENTITTGTFAPPSALEGWKEKLLQARKMREEKKVQRQRQEFFQKFEEKKK